MSENRRATVSDLSRVDAHEITPAEYQEIPELDADFFERAVEHKGGRPVRRVRPKSARPKVAMSIRLSEDVVSRFKATGPGWQSRIDAALREWLEAHPERP